MTSRIWQIVCSRVTLAFFLLAIIQLANSNDAFAQDGKVRISGTITDGLSNEPMPGVTVLIKNSTSGTITNGNGFYTIDATPAETLVYSFIGMLTEEYVVAQASVHNVALTSETTGLEEIVVVGYGVQKKSDVTGSVASVNEEQLQQISVSNAAESLKGRVSGVQINTNDASPGSTPNISIRGINSVNGSNQPLIVVDGFTLAGDLSSINPRDIKSIEVLKDASATAIYGSRGSNGVIIITTIVGENGQAKVDFTSTLTATSIQNKIEMMNGQQFHDFYTELNGTNPQTTSWNGINTDWQDEVYQNGFHQNYQLNISGGNKKTTYALSANYLDEKGIVKKSGFNRGSIRSRINSKLTSWFTVDNTLYYARSLTNRTNSNTSGYGGNPSLSNSALTFYPNLPVQNEVGDYSNMSFKTNPVSIIDGYDNDNTKNFIYNYTQLDFNLLPGLTFKTTLGVTAQLQNGRSYWSREVVYVAGQLGGIGGQSTNQNWKWSQENILNYSKSFGKHNIMVTAAYSQEYENYRGFYGTGTGFPSDLLKYNNLGGATNATLHSSDVEYALMSGLGRLFYNYNEKYFLTASVRRDGSSRFSTGNKWGTFPAFSAGWRLSEENFVKSIEWISNLKLRAGWGITGNYSVLGAYESYFVFNSTLRGPAIFNNIGQLKFIASSSPNENLTWETSSQTNIGVDLGVFDQRVNLVADYYFKETTDLLLERQTPDGALTSTRRVNEGTLTNQGLEIALTTNNLNSEKFSWTTTLNYSFNRNKVKSLPDGDIFYGPYNGIMSDQPNVLREGKPVGAFWGYVYDGVFSDNNVVYTDITSYPYLSNPLKPEGFARFKDINNDGKVDANDRAVIGSPEPDFVFGFNNEVTYRNWDFKLFIQGVVGADVYNMTRYEIDNPNGNTNLSTRLLNRWTPDNRNTDVQGAGKTLNLSSSQYIEYGSFLKFRDIQLGYSLPIIMLNRANISRLRFYVSLQNYFTITNYTGYDPELSYSSGGSVSQNLDLGVYPSTRSFAFGIQLGL